MKPCPGTVIEQKVKCGKANCRCARGQQHTAFYRFWREDHRLRKAYVPRAKVEETRRACEVYREHNRILFEMTHGAGAREVKAQIREMLRSAGAPARIIRRYRA